MAGKYLFKHGTRVHRLVWVERNGPIPEGCCIHHKDGNKSNNDISNLELMTASSHMSHHAPDTRAGRMKGLPVMLEAARKWHKSEEGSAWHQMQYERTKDRLHAKDKIHVCAWCKKEYTTGRTSKTQFCSGNCKMRFRYHDPALIETHKCEGCGAEFTRHHDHKLKVRCASCQKKFNRHKFAYGG